MKSILLLLLFIAGLLVGPVGSAHSQSFTGADTCFANSVTLITYNSARVNTNTGNGDVAGTNVILNYVRYGQTDTVRSSTPWPNGLRNLTGLQSNTVYVYYYAFSNGSEYIPQTPGYYFTTLPNYITYTPMPAAGYQFKYGKFDSGLMVPRLDTTIGRAPDYGGSIVWKPQDSTFYGYNGTYWHPLAIDSSGIIALLDGKVDSVTVSGDSLWYWKLGVSYGYILPYPNKVDSLTVSGDSICYWIGGVSVCELVPSGGGSATDTRVVYVDSTYGDNITAEVGNPSKPYATLQSANSALTTAGGVIYLGVGTYATATNWKANTTVIGSQMPYYDWTITQTNDSQQVRTAPTRLIKGTIIRGTVALSDLGSMSFQNVGFDVGSEYVTGGGTEGDCLQYIVTGTLPYTSQPNISFTNCIFLGRTAASAFHGLLIEGANDVSIENVTTCFATHGLAIKAVNVSIHNTKHYNHGSDAAIFKTDTRAAGKISYDDFFVTSLDQTTTPVCGGVYLQNAGVAFKEVSITNGKIFYANTGIMTLGRISNVIVANNIFRNNTFHGIGLDSCINWNIQGNIAQYNGGYGIVLQNGTNCVVANNILLNNVATDLFMTGYDVSNKAYYSDNLYITSSLGANTQSTGFVLPTLTSGSALFSNGTTIAQDNTNYFWDNSSKRLGIGTNAPSGLLHLKGSGYVNAFIETTTAAGANFIFQDPGSQWAVGVRPDISAGLFSIADNAVGVRASINSTGGFTITTLAGSGTRMVEASSAGLLSATNAAPTSSTYTPTLDNTTNVSSSTPIVCHYIRVGNQVTVTGSVTLTPTAAAATLTVLGISLPIASNFGATTDGSGLGTSPNGPAFSNGIYIEGNSTSDRVELKFQSQTTSSDIAFFTFTYTVI